MKKTIKGQELETVFEKGIGLENEFCEYLKTDLGWDKARVRSQMASKYNMRGTNVDVIGQRLNNKKKKWLMLVSFIYGTFFIFLLSYAYILIDIDKFKAFVFIILGFTIAYFSYSFLQMAKTNITEYAWVECKNLKGKATIKQLQIMIAERDAYIQVEKNIKIVETYFVSTNGFVETAYSYALDKKIKCFVKQNTGFRETEYWNN